jgi:putative membrane protein
MNSRRKESRLRSLIILVSAAVALSGCAARTAQQSRPEFAAAMPQAASQQTVTFFQSAVSNHLFLTQSAELALQRSRNQAIRSHAQALYNDHSQLLSRTSAVAEAARTQALSPMLQAQHFGLLSRLQTIAPAQFDETYRNTLVMAHMQAIELNQQYLISGDDPAARSLAAEVLPVLQGHLASGQSLSIGAAPRYRGPAHPGERG